MATEWFCKIMGEEWGPMSSGELQAIARWGRLTRDDIVRSGADGAWVRAELVPGLFPAPANAVTVTPDSQSGGRRSGCPAKRTMRNAVQKQYWFRIDKKIAGPFSAQQLRQLAEYGLLKRFYMISNDRRHWTRASLVKGLVFCAIDRDAATMSVRSAVVLDEPISWSDSSSDEMESGVDQHVLAEVAGQGE